MRLRFSKLTLAALAVHVSSAFVVPRNSRAPTHGANIIVSHANMQQSQSLYSSSAVASPAEGTAFADDGNNDYNDKEEFIRAAYDEWRAKFSRGDFNAQRYENFKINFETLTDANFNAQEKAKMEGKPTPKWMTLNEFGDFSMQEYETYMRQQQSGGAVNGGYSGIKGGYSGAKSGLNGLNGHSKSQDDYAEMEKAMEYVMGAMTINGSAGPEDAERVATIRAIYEDCPEAYEKWCSQFGKVADTNRYAAFAINYVAKRVFGERTGKQLQLNEYADCTKEEYEQIMSGTSYQELSVNGAKPATSLRKTYFVKDTPEYGSDQPQSKRKTELIPDAEEEEEKVAKGRPTIVIKHSEGMQEMEDFRGTQVIRSASDVNGVQGTQVIRHAGVPPPVQGTQVIRRAGSNVQGTQVIQPAADPNAPVKGTQVIRSVVTPIRGTHVIKKKPRGTRVVQQADGDEYINGAGNQDVAPRGTMVIKRQIPGPNGQQGADSNASDLSLFGGTKINGSSDRSVRGTIVLQRKSRQIQSSDRRQTLLVSRTDLDGVVPSIFSFFGGVEIPKNTARTGTIVIKKNKNDYHKRKKAEKEESLSKIKQAVEAKRLAALRKRDEKLAAVNSGPAGGPKDIPQVAEWKQNPDGSITGQIFNSNSFKDGTKITTSPIQYQAKPGYLVKTITVSLEVITGLLDTTTLGNKDTLSPLTCAVP